MNGRSGGAVQVLAVVPGSLRFQLRDPRGEHLDPGGCFSEAELAGRVACSAHLTLSVSVLFDSLCFELRALGTTERRLVERERDLTVWMRSLNAIFLHAAKHVCNTEHE